MSLVTRRPGLETACFLYFDNIWTPPPPCLHLHPSGCFFKGSHCSQAFGGFKNNN